MTPVEWQEHYDVWVGLQRQREQLADFHFSRVCAYIQNWSGFAGDVAVQPIDLMLTPFEQPIDPDRPVQTPEEIRAIYDQLAMDQMSDRMKAQERRAVKQ